MEHASSRWLTIYINGRLDCKWEEQERYLCEWDTVLIETVMFI